jgi:hypothetical protein
MLSVSFVLVLVELEAVFDADLVPHWLAAAPSATPFCIDEFSLPNLRSSTKRAFSVAG